MPSLFRVRDLSDCPTRIERMFEVLDRAALAELSPNAAEMFVLRHVEGFAIQEIAKMLQTSKGTVAVTLFRTRRRLRKSITKFLGGR